MTRPFDGMPRRSGTVTSGAVAVGLGVEGDERMGVEPPAARPTLADHLAADRLVHVILAGGQDDQVARAGQHRELERAVRPRLRVAARGAVRLGRSASSRS